MGKRNEKKRAFIKFSKKSAKKQRNRKSIMLNSAFTGGKSRHREDKAKQYTGIFCATSRGFGFVKCENFDGDIFIPASKTKNAMGGDKVAFILKGKSLDGRIDGEVREILSRNSESIFGHIEEYSKTVRRGGRSVSVKSYLCIPDDRKAVPFQIAVSRARANGAVHGDRVSVKILEYPTGEGDAVGEVVSVFGSVENPHSAALAVLAAGDIRCEFPDEVISESNALRASVHDTKNRLDLRGETVFTIDSEYAKDLDDAISVKEDSEGFTLGVHIADVSEYVRENSAIDTEARLRGTSVYFPGSVIPMLPEVLSNGLCSLNRDSEKLTLSAIIRLDRGGNILSCEVCESIISSAARGVYSELNKILDKSADAELKKKYPKEVLTALKSAVKLYKILLKKSKRRGCFELESDEAVIIFDDAGTPTDVVKAERGVTERLIEQFMLTANEAVAMLSCANNIPGIFRIHEKPDAQKCRSLLEYAENIGIDTRKYKKHVENLTPRDMQKLLEEGEKLSALRPLSEVLLRSMMKAKYSPIPALHYGLSLDFYSHFTSPIRRYADLALHRSLKEFIRKHNAPIRFNGDTPNAEGYSSSTAMLVASEAANEGELRALSAERTIDDIYKAFCMKDKINEEFDAMIISVLSFGFFVALDNTCEGLVQASSLGGISEYDEAHMKLEDIYGNVYTIGERVRVRLCDVNIYTGKLTFELVCKYDRAIDKAASS